MDPDAKKRSFGPKRAGARVALLDFALDRMSEAMFLLDHKGRFCEVNYEAGRALGYDRAELLEMSLADVDPDLSAERWSDHWRDLLARGSLRYDSRHRSKNGHIFPVKVHAHYFEKEGRAYGLSLVRDRTEQERAKGALDACEMRMRMFVDHATDAFFIHDSKGRIHDVNKQACDSLGYARDELIGMTPTELDPFVDDAFLNQLRRRLDADEVVSFDSYHRRKDGTLVPVEVRLRPFWEGGHRFSIALARDIADRLQAERQIRRLNRTYAVLSDINQLIVRSREPRSILEGACRIAVQKGGFRMAWVGMLKGNKRIVEPVCSAGTVEGFLDDMTIDLSDSGRPAGPTARAMLSGVRQVCNDIEHDPDPFLLGRREGAMRRGYRASSSFPLKIEGRVVGTYNLYADESGFFDTEELHLLDELALDIAFALEGCEHEEERLRAVDQLQRSEELLRQLAETIEEVFRVTDRATGRVLYVSPAYEAIWGRSCQSLYERPDSWTDAIHDDDRQRVLEANAKGEAAGSLEETYRIRRPDGQVRWIRERAFPVRDAAGLIERVVGVADDITESRQIAEQLRQSQKLEAIGLLAGGVAHDFNNILTGMALQADLTATLPGLPSEALESVREIRAAASRAANLTRQLLLFSRRQMMQPNDLDLNDSVIAMAKLLQRIIGEDVRMELRLSASPLVTRADEGMLEQVVMNLAVNARDAMPNGGTLTIATEKQTLDESLADTFPEVAPGSYVQLALGDTGTGIAPEVLPHIFEPFYTTKAPGHGTGLGLATVFGIVKQHRGSIAVDTQPGRGTTFRVILPASEGKPNHAAAVNRPPARGGTEEILLVEDEPSVRHATSAILARNGYQVLEAASGVDALSLWQQHRTTVALLLTDLVMPAGVSGHELARRLQLDRPDIKIIFTSGYIAEIAGKALELRSGVNFLPKPFEPQQLLEVIRRRLDE